MFFFFPFVFLYFMLSKLKMQYIEIIVACTYRCCHAYARRIESQLEEFRIEMERIRSRSDAILDMLGILHSVDMN